MTITVSLAEARAALSRFLCDLYRSDLGALRWDLRALPGFRLDECPAPTGMRPVDFAAAAVAALPEGATAEDGPLWALLREQRPGRVRDIDAMRDLWRCVAEAP